MRKSSNSSQPIADDEMPLANDLTSLETSDVVSASKQPSSFDAHRACLPSLPPDVIRCIIHHICLSTSSGVLQGFSLQQAAHAYALCSTRKQWFQTFKSAFNSLHIDKRCSADVGTLARLFGASLSYCCIDHKDAEFAILLLCAQRPRLVSLMVENLDNVVNLVHIAHLLNLCSNSLTTLGLTDCIITSPNELDQLVSGFRNLKHLKLNRVLMNMDDFLKLLAAAGERLRSLEVIFPNLLNLTGESIARLGEVCPRIEHLRLGDNASQPFSSCELRDLALSLRSSLISFDFRTPLLQREDFEFILKTCKNLRHLYVHSHAVNLLQGISDVKSFSDNLYFLSLDGHSAHELVDTMVMTESFPSLQRLKFRSIDEGTIEQLLKLIESIGTQLHALSIETLLMGDLLFSIISKCTNLRDLEICTLYENFMVNDNEEKLPTSAGFHKMLEQIGGNLDTFSFRSCIIWTDEDGDWVDPCLPVLCGEQMLCSIEKYCKNLKVAVILGLEPLACKDRKLVYNSILNKMRRDLRNTLIKTDDQISLYWVKQALNISKGYSDGCW